MATFLGTDYQLVYDQDGWQVITTHYGTDHNERHVTPLGQFLLEQTTPEQYPEPAATPLEAAQQLAVESILSRSMTLANPDAFKPREPLEQAAAFRDAGSHPYSQHDVNRLAASTLSRDIENFLDGLGMVLQPSELDALTDYLEDRG